MLEKIELILVEMKDGISTIATFCDYIIHPVKIAIGLWNGIYVISLPVCTTITIVCILLYIMGYKKYGKGATLSTIVLIGIQAIGKIGG